MFELLMMTEALLCLALLAGLLSWWLDVEASPEVALGQRAWLAARFSMAEAEALGPLFRHLVRASRHGLRRAHRMQERIRQRRLHGQHPGALGSLMTPLERRRLQRSEELAELRHTVEQLELMGGALARYRAGAGRLMELQLPLQCLQGR